MKATKTNNVLALIRKESHKAYVFQYDDDPLSHKELHLTFGRLAADPELHFKWYDAIGLSRKLRKKENQN